MLFWSSGFICVWGMHHASWHGRWCRTEWAKGRSVWSLDTEYTLIVGLSFNVFLRCSNLILSNIVHWILNKFSYFLTIRSVKIDPIVNSSAEIVTQLSHWVMSGYKRELTIGPWHRVLSECSSNTIPTKPW